MHIPLVPLLSLALTLAPVEMPDPHGAEWTPPTPPAKAEPDPSPPPSTPYADVPYPQAADLPPTTQPESSAADAKSGRGLQVTGVLIGAVGLVGLGAGAYFAYQANLTQSQLAAARSLVATGFGNPAQVAQLDDEYAQQHLASNVALGVGAGLAGLGVLLFVVGASKKRNAGSGMTLTLNRNFVGVGMGGRF